MKVKPPADFSPAVFLPDTSRREYIFGVLAILLVRPDDLSVLRHEALPWLTLLTCRSYDYAAGAYRWRVAVRAVLVDVR